MDALNTSKPDAQFTHELDDILSAELNVANVNDYATRALGKLVNLTAQVKADYVQVTGATQATSRAMEDAAFSHFGLRSIDETLGHITDLAFQITQIDKYIDEVEVIDRVLVPPDEKENFLVAGNGVFEAGRIVPKLKTTLLVLSNGFGINLHDPKEIQIISGKITHDTLRRSSYQQVLLPNLNRIILSCDQVGNATFVMDLNNTALILAEKGLAADELHLLSKLELAELINKNPQTGMRLTYSDHYIDSLIKALIQIDTNGATAKSDLFSPTSAKFLYPVMPEDHLTIFGMARLFHVQNTSVDLAVSKISEQIGATPLYRSASHITPGYDPYQQNMIYDQLARVGLFAETAPDDHLALATIAKQFNVQFPVAAAAVRRLRSELGKTTVYKFGPQRTPGYDPYQQNMIYDDLVKRGYLRPSLPEDHLTLHGMATFFKVANNCVKRAVEDLRTDFGNVETYMVNSGPTKGYDPYQQNMVYDHLAQRGLFIPAAPEDHLSILGIARLFAVDHITVKRALKKIKDIGQTTNYRFQGQVAEAYDPYQQNMIYDQLAQQGQFLIEAPENHMSINAIAKEFGVYSTVIRRAIPQLREQLGTVKIYRFGPNAQEGFDPEQRAIIKKHLADKGFFSAATPENNLSVGGISKLFSVAHNIVQRTINELGEELGHVESGRFGPYVTKGYDPQQQNMIYDRLVAHGILTNKDQDIYASINDMARLFGVSQTKIKTQIAKLGTQLGEVKRRVFGRTVGAAYDPYQQNMIYDMLRNRK